MRKNLHVMNKFAKIMMRTRQMPLATAKVEADV